MLTATSFRRFHLRSKIPANRQQPDERSPHAPPEAGGVVWLDFGAPAMFGDPDRLVLPRDAPDVPSVRWLEVDRECLQHLPRERRAAHHEHRLGARKSTRLNSSHSQNSYAVF